MVKTGVKASEKHTNVLLPIMFGRNTLQQNRFLALISNEELLLENLDVALNSTDVGTIQALESLDSLDSKINQVQVAYQQFYTTIGVEEVWKKFADGATNAINTLNGLPKAFGKVPTGAIAMVANVIGLIKTGLRAGATEIANVLTDVIHQAGSQGEAAAQQEGQKIGRSFLSFTNESLGEAWSLPNLKASVSGVATVVGQSLTTVALMMDKTSESGRTLSGVLSGLGGAAQIFGGIAKGWAGIPDILMGVMNIINGIDLGIENSEEKLERLTKEAQQLNDEAKVARAEYNSLQRTADKLDELKAKRYESAEAADAYKTAVEDLADKFPGLITGFDELGVVTIDEIGLTHELTAAREAAAEAAIAAAEADRKKAEQDLENVNKAQDRRIESAALSGLDIAEPIKDFVYKIFAKDVGNYESFSDAYKSLFDKNGNFVYKEYNDFLWSEYGLDENAFNQIKALFDEDLAKLVDGAQRSIQDLFEKNDNGEYINLTKEKVTEIQNYIIENGLEEFYKPFLEFAEEYKRGIIEINKSSNTLTGYERKELSLAIEDYKETEKEFFEKLGDNQDFLTNYLSKRAEAYKKGGKTFDEYKDERLGDDFEKFEDLFADIDFSKFNEMWENRIKYTVKDFRKIFGSNNILMEEISDYYSKTIPNYVNKLNGEIIPTLIENSKFNDQALASLRVSISDSRNSITEDLSTWISSTFELAQDYVDQGFTTAGNNILSGIAEIVGLLNSKGLDLNVRNQISEALRNANFGTIEGIDELIKTLDEMDIELPEGMSESFQKIRDQLNYNIPLGIQAWTDQLGAQTKSFSEAVAKMSKGMDIDEAIAIMESINTTDGEKIGLSDFAIKSGKFYLKDADLRKRYIESITKEQDKALEELQARIDSVLNNPKLETISNTIDNDIYGVHWSIDSNKELFTTLNNLGLVVTDELNKYFKIDNDAFQKAKEIYGGETFAETVKNMLLRDKDEGEKIQNELRAQTTASLAIEAKDYLSFIEALLPEENDTNTAEIEKLRNEAKDLFDEAFRTGDWTAVYQKYPEYAKQISETFANSAENALNEIVNNINTDNFILPVDSKMDADLLGQFANFLTPVFDEVSKEISGVMVNITKDNIDDFIAVVRASENLSDEEKASLIATATQAVLAQGDDELVNTLIDNLTGLSTGVYEQFRAKAEASGADALANWEKLWSDNGDGTYDFVGTLEDLVSIIGQITSGVTKKTTEKFAQLEKESLETIGNEIDKQIGESVSRDTAIFLNGIEGYSVREINGEWIIESVGKLEDARQEYYEELVAEFGEDAEIVKQERAKLIETHTSVTQKAQDAINSIMDATGGEWLDVSGFTSQLSKEQSAKLEASLKKFGAQIENGILKIPEGANIAGIQRAVFDTAKSASEDLKISLEELADSYAKAISKYADLISNAISGGISNAGAAQLQSFADWYGLGKLDFRSTTEGLQLAQNSAIQLYQTIKQIDDIQGQIVFKELSDSLVKNNAEYQNMTSLLAHIKELNREINDLPIGSQRREEYERELEVAKEIKETRAMTDPEYFNFMSGDLPDPLKGAETYWNSVNTAFSVMNQAAESGYMSLTNFYNLVNHMNDVAMQTGKTTEFMGVTLDGSLESASALIQQGFHAIENVDGSGAMVNLEAFGTDFEKGAGSMQSGMQRGAKAMARANIEMLDAMIGLLEVIVAFEGFGELDTDGTFGLSVGELFDTWEVNGETFGKANENAKKVAGDILEAAKTNKDLAEALDKVKVNGTSARKALEALNSDNTLTAQEMENYTKITDIMYRAAASGDYSTTNLVNLIKEAFGGGDEVTEVEIYGRKFAVKGEMVIEQDKKGRYVVDGKKYDNADDAFDAMEFKEKNELDSAAKNKDGTLTGEYNLQNKTKIKITQYADGTTSYTYSGPHGNIIASTKEELIEKMYDDYLRYDGGNNPQDKETWLIKHNIIADAHMTVEEVKATLEGKTLGEMSDEILTQLGIDTKLVGAVEAGIERALANFNLAQAIMDNLIPDFQEGEGGGYSYTENPQIWALGEQIGQGMGPSITSAVVSALETYFGTDEPKDKIKTAMETGIADAASGSNISVEEVDTSVGQANVTNVGSVDVEEGALPVDEEGNNSIIGQIQSKLTSLNVNKVDKVDVKEGALPVDEGGNNTNLSSAKAKLKELALKTIDGIKADDSALPTDDEGNNTTLDSANAKVKTLTLDPESAKVKEGETLELGNAEAKADKVDVTSATEASLNETVKADVEAKIGTVDVSSIETAQQTVTTAVTNASTSLSTLGTNISTAKTKVDNLAASLNTITENGPTRAKDFKTAINAIQEKGPTNTKNFKDAINAITATGPNQAKSFKEAVNSIASYGPTYARNFVNAVNSIRDKTFRITGSVNVTVSTSGAVTARVSANTSLAKGNIALAGGKKQTLMGELGPELYVTNGHYYIAGQNGAEMVDLPDDAIVFNHLQTERLLKNGRGGRGKPVKSEAAAVAQATGNVALAQGKPLGPAMASAKQMLAMLKELRAMWQSMLNASSTQLGIQAGKSDKKDKTPKSSSTGTPKTSGTGSGSSKGSSPISDSTPSASSKVADDVSDIADEVHNAKIGHVVNSIQDLYNELREIESLTRKIEYQSNLQKMFENDRYSNGKQIGETVIKQYEMLGELLEAQKATYKKEDELLQQDIANYEATPYGRFYDVVDDKVVLTDLDKLASFYEENEKGEGINNATDYKRQVQAIMDAGISWQDMIWDLSGNKAVATYSGLDLMYDENNKQLDEAQMSQVYQTMVQNFTARLDNYRDGFQERLDSLNDRQNEIVDIVSQRNEILNYMIDLQMELENEVLEALEDQRQTAIDNSQKERDAYEESSKAYIDGLNKSLQREREMFQAQQDTDELTRLQRQLEILQRTGGSGSQIQSLINQIQAKQQDMYFSEKENEINAIQEASDKQIERMDKQITLMTETLEFEKEHGLLWKEVDAIMSKGTDYIVDFIIGNKSGWDSQSSLAQDESINALIEKFDTLESLKDIPDLVNDAMIKVGKNVEAAVERAPKVEADEEYESNRPVDKVPEIHPELGGDSSGSGGSGSGSSSSSSSDYTTTDGTTRKNDYIDFLTRFGLTRSDANKNIISKIKLPDEAKTYDYTSTIGTTNKKYTASFKDGQVVVTPANAYEKLTDAELKEAKAEYIKYNKERYVTDLANKYSDALKQGVSDEDINYDAFGSKADIAAFKRIKAATRDTTDFTGYTYTVKHKDAPTEVKYVKGQTGIDYIKIPDNYIRFDEVLSANAAKILDKYDGVRTAPVEGRKNNYYIYLSEDFDFQKTLDNIYYDKNKNSASLSDSAYDGYIDLIDFFKKLGFTPSTKKTVKSSGGGGSSINMNLNAAFRQLTGYAKGGYVGELQKITHKNGDDGIAINTLKRGEAVLTTKQASQFSSLVDYLPVLNQALSQTTENSWKDAVNNFANRLDSYAAADAYKQITESAFERMSALQDSNETSQSSINIEKFELTMNAKISDNYSAEQAGEAVFNKMVQMARKSGNYGSISRR